MSGREKSHIDLLTGGIWLILFALFFILLYKTSRQTLLLSPRKYRLLVRYTIETLKIAGICFAEYIFGRLLMYFLKKDE